MYGSHWYMPLWSVAHPVTLPIFTDVSVESGMCQWHLWHVPMDCVSANHPHGINLSWVTTNTEFTVASVTATFDFGTYTYLHACSIINITLASPIYLIYGFNISNFFFIELCNRKNSTILKQCEFFYYYLKNVKANKGTQYTEKPELLYKLTPQLICMTETEVIN